MTLEFIKEPRYIVLKRKDLSLAIENGTVTPSDMETLGKILARVNDCRAARMPPAVDTEERHILTCVVVESDWRCYKNVWDLVRAEHQVNQLQDEIRRLEEELDDAMHNASLPPEQVPR